MCLGGNDSAAGADFIYFTDRSVDIKKRVWPPVSNKQRKVIQTQQVDHVVVFFNI